MSYLCTSNLKLRAIFDMLTQRTAREGPGVGNYYRLCATRTYIIYSFIT